MAVISSLSSVFCPPSIARSGRIQLGCRAGCTRAVSSSSFRRYAILGAGFAGVSVAWHLLQYCSTSLQVSVELYDEGGIGAGASGVSGGLLHPYSPKGKLVWKGLEGWNAALELLAVAEATDDRISRDAMTDSHIRHGTSRAPIAWKSGIVRPATSPKHTDDFRKWVKFSSDKQPKIAGLSCIDGKTASLLVPGLAISCDDLALHIDQGMSINPLHYLQALWMACKLYAHDISAKGSVHSNAVLKRIRVGSLSCLSADYDAVIICLGANANMLPELLGKLPMKLCRGVVAHLVLPPEKLGYDFEGPSVLAGTWLAVRGPGRLILGATKDWNNSDTSAVVSPEAAADSCNELFTKASAYYPSIKNWFVQDTRAGVRAMTKRTQNGKLPLLGCIDDIVKGATDQYSLKSCTHYWIFGGLGSRGLIYHSWLGKRVAEAVINNDESYLPIELTQWKHGLVHTSSVE